MMVSSQFYKHGAEVIDKMKASTVVISIHASDPDAKQCLEVGAALLLDKPIYLLVEESNRGKLPKRLERAADHIEYFDGKDNVAAVGERLIERAKRDLSLRN